MIKYIAILTMLIDHINHILYNSQYELLSQIGRLAFPCFIYLAVKSYMYYTKDKINYMARLYVFAMITIPFYIYAFDKELPLNIFFSLFLGLLTLYFIEKKYYYFVWVPIVLSLYTEYSFFAVVAFIAMYNFLLTRNILNLLFLIISLFLLNPYYQEYYLLVFVPLILVDLNYKIDFKSSLNKYFFYAFYPAHIFILGLLK